MAKGWMIVLGIGLLAGVAVAQDNSPLKSPKEKLSYALGMDLGNQLRKLSVDVDASVFGQGLKDALSGSKTLLTEEEVRTTVAELQNELKLREQQARIKAAADEKKVGEAFLAENKKKEGVVTLPSGLQYKILKAGEGRKPTIDDTVVCQYRGTFLDGTEFDSSYKRNQPLTFAVKGVIKGWSEALQLMPVGAKWQLFIPPPLAYGETGSAQIRPNATLVFEVELVSIQDKTEAAKPAQQ